MLDLAGNSLPPQNVEAEESILGGILLDPEAMGRVADVIVPEAFYISIHTEIYQAALALYRDGKPTDLMTVTSWLQDQGKLDIIGGTSKLAQLVERTVSAVNIDRYAILVMDKYTRRQLIGVSHEITELGYDTTLELEVVLDKSEQKVFGLTQKRPKQGLTPIAETLIYTFDELENLQQETALPGLACDFYDLDAMTSGFQKSDLIVLAGRPSMGKCLSYDSKIVLADGAIATIEDIFQQRVARLLTLKKNWKLELTEPSAFVDDGIKPVFRVQTRLGRSLETTLTHPYLTIQGWRELSQLKEGDRIAVSRKINIFGNEILPEYQIKLLAYFISKNAHCKEIPKIIFKLNKFGISLFLNRLFATDGWATVLKSGQSQIGYTTVSEKLAQQIQHLLLRFGIIAALKKRSVKYKDGRRVAWQLDITDACALKTFIEEIGIFGKEDAIAAVKSALSGKKYQTNRDLIPVEIWEQLTQLKGTESWQSLAKRAGILGYSNIHVGKRALPRERLLTLALALDNIPLQELATSDIYWDRIVSIEYVGNKQVYDLTIPETHNFIANDICVHNTSFALNIAANIAQQHQLPVAIFSLEMSKEQLVQRLLASEAKIESNRLRSGRITQTEMESVALAIGNLAELPIFIDDNATLTVMQMRSEVRRLQAEQGGKIGLVLLDYLQLMEGGGDNRVQELAKITRSLKGLAREINAPVIALSQLSRGVESRTNKRPMLSDLRESGSIEQDADLVIMLYRDSYYNPDSPDRNIAEVIIAKHRNGPTGTIKLLFLPELTKFENLATES
ncbi:replicative DNA helicase [Spirulina sp. 06S082]|uniref:replicative DNA helicase n=1 Tax=Spirulina sp. 06S082 TaxID=3110248 RepID=UPI002B216204|nr:replicative DNA helicase [Spirulina sp. 06S082]MEA5469409.1 replicative DNA helicase [Spirulina sp. 06S082]